jgi:hypothetical protein
LLVTRHVHLAWITLAIVLLTALPPVAAQAEWNPPTTVWVEATGHTIDGLFLTTWRGARALLGDPITEEHPELVQLPGDAGPVERIVQYFAGGALVFLEEAWSVAMMPLGIWALSADRERFPGTRLPEPAPCGDLPGTECALFAETGHSLRGGFKAFWDTNGGYDLIGPPRSETFEARDGVLTQYFSNAVLRWENGRPITPRTLGYELADRQQAPLDPAPRPEGVPVYHEELFIPPLTPEPEPEPEPDPNSDVGLSGEGEAGQPGSSAGPGPLRGAWREIVISRGAQTLWAYEDGALVLTTLVSTGVGNVPETVTPLGEWAVHTKLDLQTMEGVIAGEHYRVEDVPWVMYFDDGANALHGAYWHNNFGQPMSHGCVNLPLDIAEFLYHWSDIGTPVTIIE